jgi:peptidyl-prolyl cis-trans isomerase SurA
MRPRIAAIALFAAVPSAMVHVRAAHAEIVDRVVAVIDDDAIFLSDLERRVRPFEAQLAQNPNAAERSHRREQLYRQQLEAMIDDQLIRRAAQRAHVTVSEADVDRMVEGMAHQRNVSTADIYAAIEQEGLTRAEYRHFMESEVLRLRVMNVRIRGRVNISENDVAEEYRRRIREATDHAPFHAAHIFLAFPENPTAEQITETQRRAAVVADQVRAGGDFAQLAREFSEDAATRENGGDLGMIDPDDDQNPPPEWLVNAVRDLRPGATTAAVRGENGYHIFRLIERQAVNLPALTAVRSDLYNELLQREMDRQQRIYLRELRQSSNVEVRL